MDSLLDPNYEYDAPQFVDFTEGLQQLDPDADKWFGKFLRITRFQMNTYH